MVGGDERCSISIQCSALDRWRMAIDVLAAPVCGIELVQHIIIASCDSRIVHHLSQPKHPRVVHVLLHVRGLEDGARMLERSSRDAGWEHEEYR